MLLTSAQVAERLQVTTRTVRTWVREGRLDCIRLSSRAIRFDAAEIARFIDERTQQAAS